MQDLNKINKKLILLIQDMKKARLVEYEIRSLEKYNVKLEMVKERISSRRSTSLYKGN